MKQSSHKTFELVSIVLTGAALVTGLYLLLLAAAPWLPSTAILGTQAIDVTAELSGTTPGERGNRLYIPQINIDVTIEEGTDISVLDKGAWHRQPHNGNPEKGGNFVVSAHRFSLGWTPQQTRAKSPLYQIDKLQVGDEFFVDWNNARYAYRVARTYDVPKTAVEIEGPSKEAKLTLYSCDLRGESAGRVVVEAVPLGKV
jgi:sortase A